MSIVENLDSCEGFSSIFEIVQQCVYKSLGKKRSGLSLGLTDLPLQVGGFHAVPSNFIMLNRKILNAITQYNKKLANAYIFHVLLHEYLHTLGILDEEKVGILTYLISKKFFGEEHPSTLISKYGIGYVFPRLAVDPQTNRSITIVEDFDTENLSYIG
jgi:hypothetical protein